MDKKTYHIVKQFSGSKYTPAYRVEIYNLTLTEEKVCEHITLLNAKADSGVSYDYCAPPVIK
jgi:hypothetical protein